MAKDSTTSGASEAYRKYKQFLKGVSVNWIGRTGVILTTGVVISFFLFELAHIAGFITNAYFGLITYLAFPALFILGLILIPIGWRRYKKESGKETSELLSERFASEDVASSRAGARVFRIIAYFTLANVIIIGVASIRMLKYMDQPEFCGTACHTVMNPEWVTYQQSPHARVPCVECHVGEGVEALIASKLNGARQMFLAAFDIYNQPIPTPVHQLRPARETCEKCHWPEKFIGHRLKTYAQYANDSLNTLTYTTLLLKIDTGQSGEKGAHWHVGEHNKVFYTSYDDIREQMLEVRTTTKTGEEKVYRFQGGFDEPGEHESELRVMDCIDCHNRATHIYQMPGTTLDDSLEAGSIDTSIPFIRKAAFDALQGNYSSQEAGYNGIAREITRFYQEEYPSVFYSKRREITEAIAVTQSIFMRNIHPYMNIDWGTYPSLIGHADGSGCFRCHGADLATDDGETISGDCYMCHSILAMDSPRPLEFLAQADTTSVQWPVQKLSREEFLEHFGQDEIKEIMQ